MSLKYEPSSEPIHISNKAHRADPPVRRREGTQSASRRSRPPPPPRRCPSPPCCSPSRQARRVQRLGTRAVRHRSAGRDAGSAVRTSMTTRTSAIRMWWRELLQRAFGQVQRASPHLLAGSGCACGRCGARGLLTNASSPAYAQTHPPQPHRLPAPRLPSCSRNPRAKAHISLGEKFTEVRRPLDACRRAGSSTGGSGASLAHGAKLFLLVVVIVVRGPASSRSPSRWRHGRARWIYPSF